MVSRYTLQKLLSPTSALLLPVIYFVIFNRSRGSTAPQSRYKNPRIRIIPPPDSPAPWLSVTSPSIAGRSSRRRIPSSPRSSADAARSSRLRSARRSERRTLRSAVVLALGRTDLVLRSVLLQTATMTPLRPSLRYVLLDLSIDQHGICANAALFPSAFSLLCPLRPSCFPSQIQEPLVCLACDGWWRGQRNYGPHTTDPTLALCGPSTASTSWYLWMGTPMQGIAEVVMRLVLFYPRHDCDARDASPADMLASLAERGPPPDGLGSLL